MNDESKNNTHPSSAATLARRRRRRECAVNWVASECIKGGYTVDQVAALKTALLQDLSVHGNDLDKVNAFTLYERLKKTIRPAPSSASADGHNSSALEILAEAAMFSLQEFVKLDNVDASGFYKNARLPASLLRENGLTDYIEAAKNGGQNAHNILEFLLLLQEPISQDALPEAREPSFGDDPNTFACVLASSGTGKTQMAATASLTCKDAPTIYLNMGSGDIPQRFYRPHMTDGSSILKSEINMFLKKRGGQVTATRIANFAASGQDNGTLLFVRILYHLLTNKPFVAEKLEECPSRMTLAELKASIKGMKFLVFLDEVPPIGDPGFTIALGLRDVLRYLGIAPVLMSTHTGAQDYVGYASRKPLDVWTWVLSLLPQYVPFPPKINPKYLGLVDTERPLVIALTQKKCVVSLRQTVREIKEKMQSSKPSAWLHSPALQLVQLFCTDVELNGTTFAAAHKLVGHHFGSLLQDMVDDGDHGGQKYNPGEAGSLSKNLSVAPVCASSEPLLYLALVTWDEGMLLRQGLRSFFPLVDKHGCALTVREAFNQCHGDFVAKASTANPRAEKRDGDLLEVLVHASLTLASMKTGDDKFLPGMNLKEFLPLVRRLLLPGKLERLPDTPKLFDNLNFAWPVVPALGGSNSGLPMSLFEANGLDLGYLERHEDKEMNDGTIRYVLRDGTCPENGGDMPFIFVECKNYRDGVDSSLLKAVFQRVKHGIQCSLIFVSTLKPGNFKCSKLDCIKQECFPKNKPDSVTVLVWSLTEDNLSYLKVGGQSFVAEEKTDLLVVIIEVGVVDASIRYRNNKRKISSGANRLQRRGKIASREAN